MRRRLKHLALFLVLGAIINWSLAMGIIWFSRVITAERREYRDQGTTFARWETLGMTWLQWAPAETHLEGTHGPFPYWSAFHRVQRPLTPFVEFWTTPGGSSHLEYAAGWPLRSLTYEYMIPISGSQAGEITIRSGITLPPREILHRNRTISQRRAIPTRIIPVGFAVNTLLFASLAAMIFYAPGTIRRIRRRCGNRCLKCGYPRAGLATGAPCPECGTDQGGGAADLAAYTR